MLFSENGRFREEKGKAAVSLQEKDQELLKKQNYEILVLASQLFEWQDNSVFDARCK